MSIFSFFYKKTKQVEETVPIFNITETRNPEVDFVVSEISYEEYQNTITKERRKSIRKSPSNK